MRNFELGRAVLGAAVARFLVGGALSVSRPLASRFLRLSRLLRFARPSPWTDATLPGAGDDLGFRSENCALSNGPPLGGSIGELMFDEGAEDPGAWPDVMMNGCVFA